jgi:hypothetical protein
MHFPDDVPSRAVLLSIALQCGCAARLDPRRHHAQSPRTSPLFQKGVATMITKECFGCKKVTSLEHLHDCAPGIPETHMVGSERFVCVLCKHVTFAGSDGASRFPFTFDKVAAGR